MAYNKWIGGGLGWAFGGPIGMVLGFAVGAMIDHIQEPELLEEERMGQQPPPGATTSGDLSMSLVVLTAAIMKADGRVTRSELDHVRRFFLQQFGTAQARYMLLLLRDVLKQDIPVHQVAMQIRRHMPHAARLQLMHYLIGLAHADGRIPPPELQLLRRIAHDMGVSEKDLGSLSAMFRTTEPGAAYKILEIDPKVSDEEVKKAYRRMAMKYHPDKVAQLGEEVQKAAAEKFRKVQEAYEAIQKERGMV
jgi:DnaJ like chaperone protein